MCYQNISSATFILYFIVLACFIILSNLWYVNMLKTDLYLYDLKRKHSSIVIFLYYQYAYVMKT